MAVGMRKFRQKKSNTSMFYLWTGLGIVRTFIIYMYVVRMLYYVLLYDWSVSSTLIVLQLVTWTSMCIDIARRAICSDIDSERHLASMVKLCSV